MLTLIRSPKLKVLVNCENVLLNMGHSIDSISLMSEGKSDVGFGSLDSMFEKKQDVKAFNPIHHLQCLNRSRTLNLHPGWYLLQGSSDWQVNQVHVPFKEEHSNLNPIHYFQYSKKIRTLRLDCSLRVKDPETGLATHDFFEDIPAAIFHTMICVSGNINC
jgi:hypothetical protein